jgi:hypothetical protein
LIILALERRRRGLDGITPTNIEPGDEPLIVVTKRCGDSTTSRFDRSPRSVFAVGVSCVASKERTDGVTVGGSNTEGTSITG